MEGQGCGRDEHCRAPLLPESQRDHCGSPHGQRELYEAFRERVQAQVSLPPDRRLYPVCLFMTRLGLHL